MSKIRDLLYRVLFAVSVALAPVSVALATVNPCLLVAFLPEIVFLIAHAHALMTADALLTPVWATLVCLGARWIERLRPGVLLELRPQADSQLAMAAWAGFFQSFYGIVRPWWKHLLFGQSWIVFEFVREERRTIARCWMHPELEGMFRSLLRSAAPGLDITTVQRPVLPRAARLPKPAARARLGLWRESLIPLSGNRLDALYPVLNALSESPDGRVQVTVRPDTGWQRRAVRRLHHHIGNPAPRSLPVRLLLGLARLLAALTLALMGRDMPPRRFRPVKPLPTDTKAHGIGYRAEIRVRVSAPTAGIAGRHLQTVASTFRALDGRNGLRSRRVWLRGLFDGALVHHRPPRPTAPVLAPWELAEVFHLPVPGSPLEVAPVRLAPARLPDKPDKIICLADDARQTPAGIWQRDARQHVHILGPTGTGKSTVLLNLALDDIRAGRGVGMMDPKGDLIRDLLARIPRSEWDRVVLIDPSLTERPVGLNVIECHDAELRELVTDQAVTVFRRVFEKYWGPRSDDVLRAAIMTLLHQPDVTLCEVPLLLLRPEKWRHVIGRIKDPVGLGPWWVEYRRLSESQRQNVTGPLLYKLRAVLLRPTIRNIFGQSRSTVDLTDIMDRGGILLVSLAKGLLGEETSRLLGSCLIARMWQAALARASRPEQWRPDFTLYADEFQNYLNLPQSLGEVLAEARAYHFGLTLANQHSGQLAPQVREALTANARTRVLFQAGADDARILAREFEPLSERDLRNLQGRQVAVRLCINGRTDPPFTGRTLPPPPAFGDEHAAELIRHSLARFGRPREEVEREIVARLRSRGLDGDDDPFDSVVA